MVSTGAITSIAGAAISAYGAHAQARAAKAEGELAQRGAELEADQMRRRAKQAFAAGQRAAQDELKQAKLMQSRALMLAAAGGGGASDPSVVSLLSGIIDEGAKRASLHMQAARQESGQLRLGALATQFGGINARAQANVTAKAYQGKALTTLAGGAKSFYDSYSSGATQTAAAKPAAQSPGSGYTR